MKSQPDTLTKPLLFPAENNDITPKNRKKSALASSENKALSVESAADPNDPAQWRALCGRHQVMKKNYWDSTTGKLNLYAIMQSASLEDKRLVYRFLQSYFEDQSSE